MKGRIDFVLTDSYWHPYKPSIEIDTLSFSTTKDENRFLDANDLKIKFNLFLLFKGNLIESFYAENMQLLYYSSSYSEETSLIDLWYLFFSY